MIYEYFQNTTNNLKVGPLQRNELFPSPGKRENKDRRSLLKWPQEVTSFLERHSNEQQKP